jgi:hypothetical protein
VGSLNSRAEAAEGSESTAGVIVATIASRIVLYFMVLSVPIY